MKKTSKNQTPKAKSLNPKSKKPKGLKTVGWNDPKYPDLHFYKHENELRWINHSLLRSHCLRKANEVKCFEIAEDFAQWAVLANLIRINNGNTKNGHLNNVDWLWNEYIDREYGVKSPMGKKAQAYKNTISYDVALNENGGTLLDIFVDTNNPNPEEALEAKDAVREKLILLKNENDERKKIVPIKNYHPKSVAVENRVYDFLANRNECGFGSYNPDLLAEKCGIPVRDFKLAVGRLDKKARLIINKKVGAYYLPDEINRLIETPSKITDEIA